MSEKQYSPVNTNYPQPDASVFDDWRIHRDRAAGAAILANYKHFVDDTTGDYSQSLRHEAGGTIDRADLSQEGNKDILYRQVRYYDPNKGVRFLAYATPGIRGAIANSYFEHYGAIRLPKDFCPKLLAYSSERYRRERVMEPPLTDAEIAVLTEIPETGPEQLSERSPLTVPSFKVILSVLAAESLQALAETDPEILETMVPLTTGTAHPNHEESLFKLSVWHLLDIAFTPPPTKNQTPTKEEAELAAELENQRKAVILVHGLDDGFARSRREVADILGLPHRVFDLLYDRAMRRLRKIAEEKPEFQSLHKS